MSLKDLSPAPLKDAVDFGNLPDQVGSFTPPPPPGPYRFKVPATLGEANFDKVDTQEYGDRVTVKFDETAPLEIVQSPNGGGLNGTPLQIRVSNVPRERGKKGSGVFASDFDYLLQALKEESRPTSNLGYAQALLKHKGDTFGADVEWSWNCNPKRAARFAQDDGAGGVTYSEVLNQETGQPHQGCGRRVYQSDKTIEQLKAANNGAFPLHIDCPQCGASVRAFPDLRKYRS